MRERVLLVLLGIAVCFFAATVAERLGADATLIVSMDTADEGGPATWYSFLLLLACALVAARSWLPLGVLLALMALDEAAGLHEAAPGPILDAIEAVIGLSGTPARLMAATGALAVTIGVVLALRPWYRSLPAPTRRLIGLSTVLFFAGALAFELGARLIDPEQDGVHLWLSPVEELLEMSGAALFVYALWTSAPAVSFVDSRVNDTGARPTTCP